MSFILEALKKLEHKRKRSLVPDLLTIHDFTSEKPKRRSQWIYIFFLIMLVNAGVLLVGMHLWHSEKKDIVKQQLPDTRGRESGREISKVNLPAPVISQNSARAVPHEERTINKKLSTEAEILPEPQKTVTVPLKQVNILPQSLPPAHKENNYKTMPLSSGQTASTSEQKVPDRSELPLEVQQEIPEISIAGHIYSNAPASRIVNINGQVRHEGETVAGVLKLDEITENGIVLSYKGYRFRMRGY